jgi:hypothetical protein
MYLARFDQPEKLICLLQKPYRFLLTHPEPSRGTGQISHPALTQFVPQIQFCSAKDTISDFQPLHLSLQT